MNKAIVIGNISMLNGFNLTVSVSILNTSTNTENFTTVVVNSNQFHGGGMGWKPKIKDAIVAKALASYGITVDQVLFPDYTVL